MELKELRIGNLVYYQREDVFERFPNGKEILVSKAEKLMFKIDKKFMYEICSGNFEYSIDKFEGIPITEERLLKFGFIKENSEFKLHGFNFIILNNEVFTNDDYDTKPICKIDFVHQLQNIHFALTGKELEIK